MNPTIFKFMEACAPYLVFWSMAFTSVTAIRVLLRIRAGVERAPDSMVFTELAGLPIALLQSVCFVWAAGVGDWLSMLLFLWWGPGFIVVACAVLVAARRKTPIDWYPWRHAISWLCKGYYLAYAAAFLLMQTPTMLFAFSVWIINDQIEKALMSSDADRFRRTFDDYWLFRALYPAGLLAPVVFANVPDSALFIAYGLALLAAWILALLHVWRKGLLLERPANASLLRNMIYFRKLHQ